jgi:site-specific DNA-methyltransferase (adenine-specific)
MNNMKIDLRLGDCLEVLKTIPDNSIDAIITDPPYGIGFMNKEWDSPQKHQELIEREKIRSEERFEEGKSPVKGGFSKGVQPGLPIGGAKEGKWFQDWCELWARECFRILKPGGHALSFSAPRTYHRMATAFEDSGFQIRDQIMWVFGSGFPKSHNIGKAIDKIEGNEREVLGKSENHRTSSALLELGFQDGREEHIITKGNGDWEGWGTALKPAHEPIVMARKPLSEKSIAENVLKHGTGGINIDGSRIEMKDKENINFDRPRVREKKDWVYDLGMTWEDPNIKEYNESGRFPANIIFDEEAGQLLDEQSGVSKSGTGKKYEPQYKDTSEIYGKYDKLQVSSFNDKGGASRFFYCPKSSKKDRNEGIELINNHPTVKPTDLMRYLINLITPPNGTILDPFMGSGSTGKAAVRCGLNFIGIEKEQEYMDIASARIEHEKNKPVQQKLFNGKE